jgi:hypothetical protein
MRGRSGSVSADELLGRLLGVLGARLPSAVA